MRIVYRDLDDDEVIERECHYCGNEVAPRKGYTTELDGEPLLIHGKPCLAVLLTSPTYRPRDYVKEK